MSRTLLLAILFVAFLASAFLATLGLITALRPETTLNPLGAAVTAAAFLGTLALGLVAQRVLREKRHA